MAEDMWAVAWLPLVVRVYVVIAEKVFWYNLPDSDTARHFFFTLRYSYT